MKVTKGGRFTGLLSNVMASGVTVSDPGGVFGGDPVTLQEVIDLIAAGGFTGYLTIIRGGQGTVQDLGTLGPTATVDLANANYFFGALDQDCTLTTTGWTLDRDSQITIEIIEDGTGGWTPTFDGVTWIGGTPTWDTTAGTVTIAVLLSRDGGTTIYGAVVGGNSGGGTPATTVTDETTFGITPAVGTDDEYARQDHTHGSPPASAVGVGQILISDTPSTPLVFADLIQNDAQDDLVYADT